MLPHKFRRSMSLAIPMFTTLLLWGLINGFFGVNVTTNIAQTGVTLGFVTGALNLWLWWLAWRHKIP